MRSKMSSLTNDLFGWEQGNQLLYLFRRQQVLIFLAAKASSWAFESQHPRTAPISIQECPNPNAQSIRPPEITLPYPQRLGRGRTIKRHRAIRYKEPSFDLNSHGREMPPISMKRSRLASTETLI